MAELETKDEARAALEREIAGLEEARGRYELDAEESTVLAIGRFLLAHSHARPNQLRVRVLDPMGRLLVQRVVDANTRNSLTVDLGAFGLSATPLHVEIQPEA